MPARNKLCKCGSGYRFKHCCGQLRDKADSNIQPLPTEFPIVDDLDFWNQITSDENYTLAAKSIFEEKNEVARILNNIPFQENKIIADIGCGVGKAFSFLKNFKQIFAVDFSQNMLNIAESKYSTYENIVYLKQNILHLKLPEKADVILSACSVMPKNDQEFECYINKIKANLKSAGKLILVMPSFESETLSYTFYKDRMYSLQINPKVIETNMDNLSKTKHYSPSGYFNIGGLIQKHWVKEEIEYKLREFNFKSIEISKLHIDWKLQIKKGYMEKYPKLWFWLLLIES